MVTVIFVIAGVVLLVGLTVLLERRSSHAAPFARDVEHRGLTADGRHQGRSPGADGGGMSYYNGGDGGGSGS